MTNQKLVDAQRIDPEMPINDFAYADTRAAKMLREGLVALKIKQGKSARAVAKALGYKQSVVLSHMATGRVPVPLERAQAIADEVGISLSEFILAVVEQKVRGFTALIMMSRNSAGPASSALAIELEAIAGMSLDELTDEQKTVLREAVADPRPGRRWLSVSEIWLMSRLRDALPNLRQHGIPEATWAVISKAVSRVT